MTTQINNSSDSNVIRLPLHIQPQTNAGQCATTPNDRLSAALQKARATGRETALLVLRIGEYRVLTDTFGEDFGDELSAAVEHRVASCLRSSDVACKLSGDEFAIVLGELNNLADISDIVHRLVEQCTGSYDLGSLNPLVKTTVGIVLYPADTDQLEELLRFARIALHRADASEQSYQYFSDELLDRQQYELWMEAELERALCDNRFTLHYQPQYKIGSLEIVGMEALVRMTADDGQLIQPDQFIPLAEENGSIVKLGSWVIREACSQLAAWRAAGCGPLRMAVNVSPRQLADRHLIDVIDGAIEEFGLSYADLEIEITEQCMLDGMPQADDVLRELHAKGVRIAVDDFGTGYSSFSYLARLPLSVLKMDRSFMADTGTDTRAGQVVSAMIAMARELGFEVIAEGVETQQQYEFLQANGCDLGQGFGLARPQTAQAISALLLESVHKAIAG